MRVDFEHVFACTDAGNVEGVLRHVVVFGKEVDAWFGDLDV